MHFPVLLPFKDLLFLPGAHSPTAPSWWSVCVQGILWSPGSSCRGSLHGLGFPEQGYSETITFTKCRHYCLSRKINQFHTTLGEVLDFLIAQYHEGIKYSVLNTARSALSAILTPMEGKLVGDHPLISKFFKGVLRTQPSLTRYIATWDSDIVVMYLKVLCIDFLKNLTLKVTMLMALITAQRAQTLHCTCLKTQQYVAPGNHISHLHSAQNSVSRVSIKIWKVHRPWFVHCETHV